MRARPSGALWLPERRVLVVSDLHLGKAERIARRGGPMLPPYDSRRTLERLGEEISACDPACVISLGDGFDDSFAALNPQDTKTLQALQAGRRWIWVEGNHDPGPAPFAGESCAETQVGAVRFRHIALPDAMAQEAEVSGHYHPKAAPPRGRMQACFLTDGIRLILPAFGAYTGGLPVQDAAFDGLFQGQVLAVLTGRRALPMPVLTGGPGSRLIPG